MNISLFELAKVTLAARKRTGKPLGTQVKAGLLRVVAVTYNNSGASTVEVITDYMTADYIYDYMLNA